VKLVQIFQPGGPDALVISNVPAPMPGAGQVRVAARAIGVGRPDVLMRNGTYKWMPPLPATPGGEMAGVIDAVGDGVAPDLAGRRVLVSARELTQRGGCYAEAICVPADTPFELPESISFEAALSLPNFLMADALLNRCNPGVRARRVLLTGAAGGVASAVIQLARLQDSEVIGVVSSPEKAAFAAAMGATHVIDRGRESIPASVMALTGGEGVDLALDHIGAGILVDCLHALAPFGMAVSYNIVGGPPQPEIFGELRKLVGRSLALRCFSIHSFDHDRATRRAATEHLIGLMAEGRIAPPAATRMPLDAVRDAHRILDAGETMGKIILTP